LAVGPPGSQNGLTYLIPQLLNDGSYIITVPNQGVAGIDPLKTAKPIYLTLSGFDLSNSTLDFITYDNNMQQISQGTLTLSNPLTAVNDGGGINTGAFLNPVAPNPAKNFVTITFSLSEIESSANLSIIDLQGKTALKVFDNATLEQGSHIYGVDVSNLPSGVYIISLQTGNGIITKSLEIVR
jgi:hypothetical protein